MLVGLAYRHVRVLVLTALLVAVAVGYPASLAAQPAAPGPSRPAIVHQAVWYLRDSLTTGVATSTFRYGRPGDLPVMGDWDGDGQDTVGVVRFTGPPGGPFTYTWHLRGSNSAGPATEPSFVFGEVRFVAVDQLGTIPVVGDWDGDGRDTAGVVLYDFDLDGPVTWLLRNDNSAGPADITIHYGRGRDLPIVGDWNGDGIDTPGVFRRPRQWLLRNSTTSGVADISFFYGTQSILELPVTGDWDGNGTDTPAVLRNQPPTDAFGGFERWLFRNSNTTGVHDGEIVYGSDRQEIPLPIDYIPRLSWK